MAGHKKKKKKSIEYKDVELNIMPFIDVFSMLNTFLLFSAVFLSVGIIEVQIPFLSNAPVTKEEQQRTIDIKVEVTKDKVTLSSEFSAAPIDRQSNDYELSDTGMDKFHSALVALRVANQDTKKLTVFSDDDVKFDQLTQVLDTIKNPRDTDPDFFEVDSKTGDRFKSVHIFSQVVMGSVIL